MFLILGRPQCDYCQRAKGFLESKGLSFIYLDITIMCEGRKEGWKSLFNKAFPSQHAFPVIFKIITPLPPATEMTLEDLQTQMLIGNYFELEEFLEDSLLEESPITLSTDY